MLVVFWGCDSRPPCNDSSFLASPVSSTRLLPFAMIEPGCLFSPKAQARNVHDGAASSSQAARVRVLHLRQDQGRARVCTLETLVLMLFNLLHM